ncbi:MAG: DUF3006 domain-containing protein [Clostridia bacterium]|nr:DUF3006 domain-containing protein [Clostridia bacterium]
MQVIIDRFEEGFAVVEIESGKMVNMPRELLPAEAKEGDVINIFVDQEETTRRKKNINNLMNSLFG